MSENVEVRFGLEPDPDQGAGASSEECASWGWIEILVGNTNLCRHVSGSGVEEKVHWYLLPLLEWFVLNWDSFLHESRMPAPLKGASSARDAYMGINPFELAPADDEPFFAWWKRHAFRAAAPGAALPDLFIRRNRNAVEFSWGHANLPGVPDQVRFLAPRDRALLDALQTAGTLHEAIGSAITAIRAKAGSNARIDTLSVAHERLRGSSQIPRASWMAGWDCLAQWTEKLPASLQRLLILPSEPLVIGHAPAALLMFGSLSPSIEEQDFAALLAMLEGSAAENVFESALPSVPSEALAASAAAWDQGYDLARQARQSFSLEDHRSQTDISGLLASRGVLCQDMRLSDRKIRAIAICGDGLRPTIAVNRSCHHNESEPGLRFTLAHELCHLLYDREEGVPLAVASGPWAPPDIEKRANAFAAMFLLPTEWARQLLDEYCLGGKVTTQAVSRVSKAAGLGRLATLKHLGNLGLIDSDEVDSLEEDLASQDPLTLNVGAAVNEL